MDFLTLMENIRWLPVVVMTIFSFMLGALWHSSMLFGKSWKKENHYDDQVKVNAPLIFGGTAIMHFVAIVALSAVISGMGSMVGLAGGLLIALVWVLPTMAGTYLFANRSLKLLAIDAGMYIVLFSIAGLVLGIW